MHETWNGSSRDCGWTRSRRLMLHCGPFCGRISTRGAPAWLCHILNRIVDSKKGFIPGLLWPLAGPLSRCPLCNRQVGQPLPGAARAFGARISAERSEFTPNRRRGGDAQRQTLRGAPTPLSLRRPSLPRIRCLGGRDPHGREVSIHHPEHPQVQHLRRDLLGPFLSCVQ
jgi:hypothetical protein